MRYDLKILDMKKLNQYYILDIIFFMSALSAIFRDNFLVCLQLEVGEKSFHTLL